MDDNIGAIILAAGISKRMGKPKLFLPLCGKPLFLYAVDAARTAGIKPIVLVGGKYVEEQIKHVANLTEIEVIENKEYESGMASSLREGIKALMGRVDAAVVYLADQPFVPPIVTKKLLESYHLHRREGIRILRPAYNGIPGHPILFDSDLFMEFEFILGDEGGKSIVKNYLSYLKILNFENSQWGMDVDTPEDLEKVKRIAPKYIKMQ